jgi:nucleolar protein TMA23
MPREVMDAKVRLVMHQILWMEMPRLVSAHAKIVCRIFCDKKIFIELCISPALPASSALPGGLLTIMDAHALLTSQGWRGTGNSLHPTSNSIGLSRPLLVSQKQNTLGVGKKQHRTSDMWWMNAFDSSLKGLDTSKEGKVIQTVTNGGLDMVKKGGAKFVGNGGGLYASFVRGEPLSGTLTPEESGASTPVEYKEESRRKRKRDEDVKESKEERRARRAAKRALRTEGLSIEDAPNEESSERSETKEERRARKAAKKALKEQEASETPHIEEQDGSPEPLEKKDGKARKTAKHTAASLEAPVEQEEYSVKKPESKEERKERKRLAKLGRETKDVPVEGSSEKAKKKKRRKE